MYVKINSIKKSISYQNALDRRLTNLRFALQVVRIIRPEISPRWGIAIVRVLTTLFASRRE